MLFTELQVKVVTVNTLEKLTEMLRDWMKTEQKLISRCINTLQIVLNLQNI